MAWRVARCKSSMPLWRAGRCQPPKSSQSRKNADDCEVRDRTLALVCRGFDPIQKCPIQAVFLSSSSYGFFLSPPASRPQGRVGPSRSRQRCNEPTHPSSCDVRVRPFVQPSAFFLVFKIVKDERAHTVLFFKIYAVKIGHQFRARGIIRIGQDYNSTEYEQVPTSLFGEKFV